MAGRGIPRRYSNQTIDTGSFSKTDQAAILFRSRQEAMSTQPVLDADVLVKALAGNAKASGSNGGTRTTGEDIDPTIPQIKLDWNPRAKRRPGQVLKLHASYKELTSRDGAKWGWVDPPKKLSQAEKNSAWNTFIDEYQKRPKPILRFFANGPDGKPTKKVVKEMEVTPFGLVDRELPNTDTYADTKNETLSLVTKTLLSQIISTGQIFDIQEKKLGQTIRELLPSQRLDLARAVARGLVVDADGKMRCPPGTPNANQFTDITMSNCLSVSPVEAVGRFRRWANNINARADQINTEKRVEEMVGSIQERFDKARENINTPEGSKQRQDEIDVVNEKFLRDLRDANGLSIDERLTAAGFNLNDPNDVAIIERTNARHLMGLEILREQGEGPEWRGLMEDMVVPVQDPNNPNKMVYETFSWDPTKSFKENMEAYHNAIQTSTLALMGNQLLGTHDFGNGRQRAVTISDLLDKRIRSEIMNKRPDMITRSNDYIDFMVRANTSVRKGHLKALIDSRNDNPDLFNGITELRAYGPQYSAGQRNSGEDFLTTQGMLSALPDDGTGGVKLELALNSWSRVLKPLLESESITVISANLTKTNPYGVSVEMDFESVSSLMMNEQQKLVAFEELLSDSMDADLYARSMKATPENSIEKAVDELIKKLQKAKGTEISSILEQFGITGYKMPSGADLVKLQQELAKRLGVSPEVVQNAWQKFTRDQMFGADMSAARAFRVGGNLFDAVFEKRASHDAYHEFGHAMQYQSAQNFIKDFATQNGGFPVFENGRLVRTLPADTNQWTSKEWMDAVYTTVTKNPEWLQNWPPSGVSEMEGKMLHVLAGAYYQNIIGDWFKFGGGNTQPGLQVGLTEAHVELHALRKTGVLKGPAIDEALEYMDKAIPGNRGTPRDFDTPRPDPTPDPTPEPPGLPPGGPTPPGPTPPTPPGPTPPGPTPGGPTPGGRNVNITIGDTIINNSGNTNITVIGDNNIVVNAGDIVVGPIILPDGTTYDGDSPINVTVNVNINVGEAGSGSKERSKPRKKPTPKPTPDSPTPDGETPGEDTPDVDKPESRADRASRDLWRRINGYIAEDNASEWKVAPTARGLRPGSDRSQQKPFIDEVFDLTADDTSVGGAGDALADPFGSTQAYKSMSPDQLDARYDKINSQVRDLIDQSRTRKLSKDEQAKVWLGIKGMRQIIRENQERAQYSDAKRAAVAASKRQPDQRPGKYLSKTDGTSSVLSTKTATSVRRRSLEKARAQRGDDVVEIDEDELIHHQRSITKHAGRATNGKDGWSVSDSEYEAGKAIEVASHVVADMPAEKTKDGKARQVRPNAATSPASYGEITRAKTESLLDEDELKAVSSEIPFDERDSVMSLFGPDEMTNVLKRSASARKSGTMGGEKPPKGSPDVQTPLFDEEITSAIGPSLRALDKSFIDQDVEAHVGIPEDSDASDLGQGEIISITGMMRGRMVSYADSENLGSAEMQATRRVRIIAPAGSRGLTQKNLTDGSMDDIIFPPGEFVVTDIDSDGTITLIPNRQQNSEQTIEQMIKDIDEVLSGDLTPDERAEAKSARVAALSELRKSQLSTQNAPGPIGSKSTTRGVSGDIGSAKRGRSRNVSLGKEFADSGSRPFDPDENFLKKNPYQQLDGSGSVTPLFPAATRSQIKRQNMDAMIESLAKIKELVDSVGTDGERPLPDSLTPQIRELIATSSPEEIADIISSTLLDFHNGLDERIRIDLDVNGLADLMENGRVRTFSELRPDSSATQMRESFETSVGFSPDIDPASRTLSGRVVHKSAERLADESIRQSSKNAVTGKVSNLSSTKRGKETIEIIALPEVAQRSSYSRGSAIKDRDSLSPLLSQDKADVVTALGDMTAAGDDLKINEIARILNAGMINRPDSLIGGEDDQDGLGAGGFEALIPGGLDFTEIEEIRVPASMVRPSGANTFDSLFKSSAEFGKALSENDFTPDQRSRIVEMINSGELDDLIPGAGIARQRNGAKSLSEEFASIHGKAVKITFTRQDGVDIMNDRGFNAFPGVDAVATADEALAYRSAVEIATNHTKIKERIDGSKSSTKRPSSSMSVNDALTITGSKSSTARGAKARRGAGVAARVIGSDRARKLLERAGLSEQNAEATQFIGELAAAFSLGGPGGLAAVFARRGARDLADIGLREAIDRGWLSPDQARRVEQQLLDRVAPEGLPERLTEAIQKGTQVATSEATRERAREVADAAREFIRENETLDNVTDRVRDVADDVADRARDIGGSVRERFGRRRGPKPQPMEIEQGSPSPSFDDPFRDIPAAESSSPSFDPFATDVDPFADTPSSGSPSSASTATTDPFAFDPFASDVPIQGSRSSTSRSAIRELADDIAPRADRALQAIEDAVPESQKEAFNKLKDRLQNLDSADYAKMIAMLSAIYSKSSLPGASKLKELFGGKIQELLDNPQLLMKLIDAFGSFRGNSGTGKGSTPSRLEMAKIIGKLLAIFASGKKSLDNDVLNEPETQILFSQLFEVMLNDPDSIFIQNEEQ